MAGLLQVTKQPLSLVKQYYIIYHGSIYQVIELTRLLGGLSRLSYWRGLSGPIV